MTHLPLGLEIFRAKHLWNSKPERENVLNVLAAGKQNLPGRKNPPQQSVHSRNFTGVKHFRCCSRNETLDDSGQECTRDCETSHTHLSPRKHMSLNVTHRTHATRCPQEQFLGRHDAPQEHCLRRLRAPQKMIAFSVHSHCLFTLVNEQSLVLLQATASPSSAVRDLTCHTRPSNYAISGCTIGTKNH